MTPFKLKMLTQVSDPSDLFLLLFAEFPMKT